MQALTPGPSQLLSLAVQKHKRKKSWWGPGNKAIDARSERVVNLLQQTTSFSKMSTACCILQGSGCCCLQEDPAIEDSLF